MRPRRSIPLRGIAGRQMPSGVPIRLRAVRAKELRSAKRRFRRALLYEQGVLPTDIQRGITMSDEITNKGRGKFDEEKASKYKDFLGRPISIEEIRLIPYLTHCAIDHCQLDRSRMTANERAIVSNWESFGHLKRFPYVVVTPVFWRFMSDVMLDFYIDEPINVEGDR